MARHGRTHQDSALSVSIIVNGRSILGPYSRAHVEVAVDPNSGLSVEDASPMVSVLKADLAGEEPEHGWVVIAGGVVYEVTSSREADTTWDLFLEVQAA